MSQFRATPHTTPFTSSAVQTTPQHPTSSPSTTARLNSHQSSGSSDYGTITEEDIELFSLSVSPAASSDLAIPPSTQQHHQLSAYEVDKFDGSDYGELEFDDDREIEALFSIVTSETARQHVALAGGASFGSLSSPTAAVRALATDHKSDFGMENINSGELDSPAISIQYEDSTHSASFQTWSSQENPEPRPEPPAVGTPFPEILTKYTYKLSKLSVTDISSPSWCEQQFVYDLSTHGRKPPTPAMLAGTAVHEKLESELQQYISVDLTLPEEEWGLKLFNTIQGLHALRYEGVTREVPVYGIHRGRVIMGIIDEIRILSATSKDSASAEEGFSDSEDGAYPYPLTISQPPAGIVQLTDHKTRQKNSVPSVTSTAAIPTKIQMMIYYHLLKELPNIDIDEFGRILKIDVDRPFSDNFLVKIGSIAECSPFPTYSDSSIPSGNTYTLETFLQHNSIRGFYELLKREYPLTVASISPSLRICYRAASTGHIISNKFIQHSPKFLHQSLEHAFDFWEGKRDPVGVGVSDVWKCKFCEFIDTCAWRKKKAAEDLERARQKKEHEAAFRKTYALQGVTIAEAMRAGQKGMGMKEAMLRETGRPARPRKPRYDEREWWESIADAGAAVAAEQQQQQQQEEVQAPPIKEIEESVTTLYAGIDAAVQTDQVPLPIFAPPKKERRRRRTKAEMQAARAAASASSSSPSRPVAAERAEARVRATSEAPEVLMVARKRGRPRKVKAGEAEDGMGMGVGVGEMMVEKNKRGRSRKGPVEE